VLRPSPIHPEGPYVPQTIRSEGGVNSKIVLDSIKHMNKFAGRQLYSELQLQPTLEWLVTFFDAMEAKDLYNMNMYIILKGEGQPVMISGCAEETRVVSALYRDADPKRLLLTSSQIEEPIVLWLGELPI
jgi:hypothetical protein